MNISIGSEINYINIYDFDDPVRSKVYKKLQEFMKSLSKGNVKCVGKYKNGLSMDFCDICAKFDLLKEVVVPYEDNDNSWPEPVKYKFKEIIRKSDSIRLLARGGFNPKKIKDMDEYVKKNSDYIINIEIYNFNPKITLIKNEY